MEIFYLKPFKSLVDLLISKKKNVETPPNADDVIMIRSPMNKTSSVTFKLTNIAIIYFFKITLLILAFY